MNVELTQEVCIDVAEALGLPHPGLVEKDYYVVRALRALNGIAQTGVDLVFGGGTSLCRAYRMIERMSEDIDLRIVSASPLTEGGRRQYRQKVTKHLRAAGFEFDPKGHLSVHDGGKTFVYSLSYIPVSGLVASLRPEVKIEISSWPLLRKPVPRSVSSFLAQARGDIAEVPEIQCVDVTETAADKFVALTRRIAEERATQSEPDRTLLRHIYDLHRLRPNIDMGAIGPMIRGVMESDRKTRGRKFPEYAADPRSVSLGALLALALDASYADAFGIFQRDMVYGEHLKMEDCLQVLDEYAALLNAACENDESE